MLSKIIIFFFNFIFFFLFFPTRLKYIDNFLLLTLKVPTRITFLPKKMLTKKIEALFLAQNVTTDTKKIVHCKNNTFIVQNLKKIIVILCIINKHIYFKLLCSVINGYYYYRFEELIIQIEHISQPSIPEVIRYDTNTQ